MYVWTMERGKHRPHLSIKRKSDGTICPPLDGCSFLAIYPIYVFIYKGNVLIALLIDSPKVNGVQKLYQVSLWYIQSFKGIGFQIIEFAPVDHRAALITGKFHNLFYRKNIGVSLKLLRIECCHVTKDLRGNSFGICFFVVAIPTAGS